MQNLNTPYDKTPSLQSACNFIDVPLCYQETEYTCGVASIQSVLARYGMYFRQSALADVLHSQPIIGTDFKSIIYFAKLLGLNAKIEENLEIEDLKNYIEAGIAPILIIQAWRLEDDIEYSLDWKNAHYVVACGYYANGIIAMDPNLLGNYAYLPNSELMERWHGVGKDDIRHIRSALIIENESYPIVYNPGDLKYLR